MNKTFLTSSPTREHVDNVINDVFQLVCSTMGCDGRLVLIQLDNLSKTTKDGVTVAKAITYPDVASTMIARMVTEAAIQTDEKCGDGTTTTVFLTYHLYEMFKNINTFKNKRRLEALIKESIESIRHRVYYPKSVDDEVLYKMAMTTSNNDQVIVDKVLQVYRNARAVPKIEILQGSTKEDIIESYPGISISGGFAHPLFSSNQAGGPIKLRGKFNPVVIDKDITLITCHNPEERINKLQDYVSKSDKPVIIFCRSMDNELSNAIAAMNNRLKNAAVNSGNDNFQGFALCVKVNAHGSVGTGIMSDMALLVNTKMITDFDIDQFDRDVISETELVIRDNVIQLDKIDNDLQERIEKQVALIKQGIHDLGAGQQNSAMARIMNMRIHSLVGGRVKIFVGGDVASDVMERQDRFTDVKEAVKSALVGGIIPGCGSVLLELGRELKASYPDDEIANKLAKVFSMQFCHLMGEDHENIYSVDPATISFTNLATGESANTPEDIGVYDTAEALLNALRAGYKTSSLLMDLSGVLLGNNLGRQTIQIG